MEERKQKEIEYYNQKGEELSKETSDKKWSGDFEGFEPQDLASFRFLYKILKEHCRDKLVLDYGCGNGIHSFFPIKAGAKKVIGIDLSEKLLEIAREGAKKEGLEEKTEFLMMDCEKLEFPDAYFDVILESGAFSSLDLKKALPELARVLKQEGCLIGIETFGHNPIANLKRRINKLIGKRTGWAESHIFQKKDLEEAKNYFGNIETYFFHPVSFLVFPFLNLSGAKFLLKIFEAIDKIILLFPFLRNYAFKTVFVFSKTRGANDLHIADGGILKRLFDVVFSFFGLILALIPLILIGVLIKIDSNGPIFYRGKRAGKKGKEFRIFKFRTMVPDAEKLGGPSTSGDDPRMTKIGRFLRHYKLDELPQLINLLKGEMSVVGPRPEVPSEVETYDEESKRIILSVKPGMTDLASLSNLHEEEVLRGAKDPHEAYRQLIKPQKIKLAKEYVKTRSFLLDVKIIFRTIKSIFF